MDRILCISHGGEAMMMDIMIMTNNMTKNTNSLVNIMNARSQW